MTQWIRTDPFKWLLPTWQRSFEGICHVIVAFAPIYNLLADLVTTLSNIKYTNATKNQTEWRTEEEKKICFNWLDLRRNHWNYRGHSKINFRLDAAEKNTRQNTEVVLESLVLFRVCNRAAAQWMMWWAQSYSADRNARNLCFTAMTMNASCCGSGEVRQCTIYCIWSHRSSAVISFRVVWDLDDHTTVFLHL